MFNFRKTRPLCSPFWAGFQISNFAQVAKVQIFLKFRPLWISSGTEMQKKVQTDILTRKSLSPNIFKSSWTVPFSYAYKGHVGTMVHYRQVTLNTLNQHPIFARHKSWNFRWVNWMNFSWLKNSSNWNFHLVEKSFGWLSFSWVNELNFGWLLILAFQQNICPMIFVSIDTVWPLWK